MLNSNYLAPLFALSLSADISLNNKLLRTSSHGTIQAFIDNPD